MEVALLLSQGCTYLQIQQHENRSWASSCVLNIGGQFPKAPESCAVFIQPFMEH